MPCVSQEEDNVSFMANFKSTCKSKNGRGPLLATCITLYNENLQDFKGTMESYAKSVLLMQSKCMVSEDDFAAVVVLDGFDQLGNGYGKNASENQEFQKFLFETLNINTDLLTMGPEEQKDQEKADKLTQKFMTKKQVSPNNEQINNHYEMKKMTDMKKEGIQINNFRFCNPLLSEEQLLKKYKTRERVQQALYNGYQPDLNPLPVTDNILHIFSMKTAEFTKDNNSPNKQNMQQKINFVFCIKQKNAGKVDSHRWFYRVFCDYLNPKFVMLLDAGTQLDVKGDSCSMNTLLRYMLNNKKCGGSAGEIEAKANCNVVELGQLFEYKMSHAPDKYAESLFGFNKVLPGAYCMLRWNAISYKKKQIDGETKNLNAKNEKSPVDVFLLYEEDSKKIKSLKKANEYIAEDRIMCIEISLVKNFYLTYVPDAKAFTDVPSTMIMLIMQRRRWLNGAFFSSINMFQQSGQFIKGEDHSRCTQFFRFVYISIELINFTFQLFTLAISFVIATRMVGDLIEGVFEDQDTIDYFSSGFNYLFIAVIACLMFVSMAGNPDNYSCLYITIAIFLDLIFVTAAASAIQKIQALGFYTEFEIECANCLRPKLGVRFNHVTLIAILIFSSVLHPILLRPFDFLSTCFNCKHTSGMISYLFTLPHFTLINVIHSQTQMHDVSWGTRPSNDASVKEVQIAYQKQRMLWFVAINFLNIVAGIIANLYIFEQGTEQNSENIEVIEVFGYFVAFVITFKFILAAIWIVCFRINSLCTRNNILNYLDKPPPTKDQPQAQSNQEAQYTNRTVQEDHNPDIKVVISRPVDNIEGFNEERKEIYEP